MPHSRRIALLLVLVTLVLYLPVAWFDFVVYDDPDYITENPVVQAGLTWSGVKWAFTTLHASNWFPLIWVSLMLDCTLFGVNPAASHLVNALLHAVNAALLFLLLLRITLKADDLSHDTRRKTWAAAFIAALFAWHPMHVESVAWVTERKDVLSTLFALLTLLAYAHYAIARTANEARAKIYYRFSLLAFALGLMSKQMLVTLPAVMLLLDFWPLRRFTLPRVPLRLILEKVPFLLMAVAAAVVTVLAQSQQSAKAVVSLEVVSLWYRLKNVPVAYVEYICKNFWPVNLAVFYPLPDRITSVQVVIALVPLLCLTLVAIWLHRSRPYWLTGWLWFVGMLVPVIGIVQVGGAQFADRYSYLSSVGLLMIVTYGAMDLAGRWRLSMKLLGGLAVGLVILSAALMEKQLWYWRNSETLFRRALEVAQDNDVARNNLGVALLNQNRLAEAEEQFRVAVQLAPTRYQGIHNLANVLDRLGRHDEALTQRRAALKNDSNVPFLHHALGLSLATVGQADAAILEFQEAARLDPHYGWPHLEIARIALRQGKSSEAIDSLRAALRADPDNVEILLFTARVLASSDEDSIRDGNFAFALAAKANILSGGNRPEVLDVLGMACAQLGKFDEAGLAAQQALDIATALKLTGTEPIHARIQSYQQHQPWRESFRSTNSPAKN